MSLRGIEAFFLALGYRPALANGHTPRRDPLDVVIDHARRSREAVEHLLAATARKRRSKKR
ncbi:MAG TPA: hypothetical protein VKZ50_05080 [bacterium]|nr:hypothetical protein [bacterium]